MSKKKSLNKNKGPQIPHLPVYRAQSKGCAFTPVSNSLEEGLTYIALDSCSVINMAKLENRIFDTAFKKRSERNLRQGLEEIKKLSAIRHGYACERGKYVLCIVPAVLEEVDMAGKQFSETIHKHLKEMYLILRVKPEFQAQFDFWTSKIMKEFERQGLFVDGWGCFMEQDAKITAQAAIFNLAIASQDQHLISQSNGHRQHIKRCCSRYLQGDHNGHQAVPMSLTEILTMRENGIGLPELENSSILTDETRKILGKLGFKANEARQNQTLFMLESPVEKIVGHSPSPSHPKQKAIQNRSK